MGDVDLTASAPNEKRRSLPYTDAEDEGMVSGDGSDTVMGNGWGGREMREMRIHLQRTMSKMSSWKR